MANQNCIFDGPTKVNNGYMPTLIKTISPKHFLGTCLFVFLAHVSLAQIFIPSESKLYESLIGEVHVLTLFIDTYSDSWEADEIEHYYRELEIAQQWIVDQANNYNQKLQFNNDAFFFDNKEIVYLDRLTRNDSPNRVLQKILVELNYESTDHFLKQNNFDFSKKKLKLLLFVKSPDRSHAYNYWSLSKIDIAIVYCTNSFGMRTHSFIIAHEMLHQFGAWDLYYGKSQSLENARKAKSLFPNSIMINTRLNTDELMVDELTAWRVGWQHDVKETYLLFDPRIKWRKNKITN